MQVAYLISRHKDTLIGHGACIYEPIDRDFPCDNCVWFVPGTFDADCDY